MFKDYYAILEVDFSATPEEIKVAFRKQAIRWHPDKNPGKDTTMEMQEINEAKLILLDTEARERYNKEYLIFKEFQKQKERASAQQEQYEEKTKQEKEQKTYEYENYDISDDILKKWMDNAKRQAVDLAKQTIEDLKGMASAGAKAAVKEGGNALIYQLIIGAVVLIIIAIIKSVNHNSSAIKKDILITYVIPDTIKIDTTYKTISFNNFAIEDFGEISIPKNMEMQTGKYKELNLKLQKGFEKRLGIKFNENRIVFQQKGLNKFSKDSYKTYARLIIETTLGNAGEFLNLTDTTKVTDEEMKDLNHQMREQIEKSFKGTDLHITDWKGTQLVVLNEMPAVKVSYQRELGANPFVHVDIYYFQNNDRMHCLTFSFREQDYMTWEPLFSKSLMSFKITNIK